MSMHTTADDPTRYRTQEEVDEWKKRDPIERFRRYLKSKGVWNERFEKRVLEDVENEVENAVREAEAFRTYPENMFRYVYSKMPAELKEQEDELARFAKR